MYISLSWGGGGDMSTKPRSKVRTFDLPLSNVCTKFFLCIELDRNKRYEVIRLAKCSVDLD